MAQRNLREMKKGDRVFFYHTGKEKAIIGTATVSKTAYPDPKDKAGNLVVVELAAGKPLKRPVTLAEVKADKRFADMPLVRIARLSVQPVTDEQWDQIEAISKVLGLSDRVERVPSLQGRQQLTFDRASTRSSAAWMSAAGFL